MVAVRIVNGNAVCNAIKLELKLDSLALLRLVQAIFDGTGLALTSRQLTEGYPAALLRELSLLCGY